MVFINSIVKCSVSNLLTGIFGSIKIPQFIFDGANYSNTHRRKPRSLIKILFANCGEIPFFTPIIKLAASGST
jgi:hypothetical protein